MNVCLQLTDVLLTKIAQVQDKFKKQNLCFGVIYKITSPNQKIYIGQTSALQSRLNGYKEEPNSSQRKLFNSLTKYGYEQHKIEILYTNLGTFKEVKEYLDEKEKYYILYYDTFNNGLNLTKGGGGTFGYRFSDEQRKRQRDTHLGKKLSPESIAKRSITNTGKKRTKETCDKISRSNKGKIVTQETRDKISKAKIGTKQKPEYVEKRRISNTGKKRSDEFKKRMSDAHKGKKLSLEHRKSLSRSGKGKIISQQAIHKWLISMSVVRLVKKVKKYEINTNNSYKNTQLLLHFICEGVDHLW